MKTSGFDKEGCFELTLVVRDKDGNDTGKRRTFRTNQGDSLALWFEQNSFRRKVKKKKKQVDKKEQLTGEQAEEILADLYSVNEEEDNG